ncbi:hypothetical protein TSUD_56330 [Trifolium subterraneum]|uniref:Endonuclease/exonuclease/phosphatase domain-containing protein n=1 Tax=Trifolium subterraneum TaxID=3900 RepID=A0A2Z6P069_TRISU|nr:hypothetical protein TSUD_56330 [Trifolium subterraneum]
MQSHHRGIVGVNEDPILEYQGSGGVGEEEGGASGGLLTLWDTMAVEVWPSTSREHILWCHDRFLKSSEEFYLVNVYAPCDAGAKQTLWNSLSGRIQLLNGERVCVCGDFNAVRRIEERRPLRTGPRPSDHIPFNQFIDDSAHVAQLRGLSDHCPLVLEADEQNWGPRLSRMLKRWKDIPGYHQFVRENWTAIQMDGWGGYMKFWHLLGTDD